MRKMIALLVLGSTLALSAVLQMAAAQASDYPVTMAPSNGTIDPAPAFTVPYNFHDKN